MDSAHQENEIARLFATLLKADFGTAFSEHTKITFDPFTHKTVIELYIKVSYTYLSLYKMFNSQYDQFVNIFTSGSLIMNLNKDFKSFYITNIDGAAKPLDQSRDLILKIVCSALEEVKEELSNLVYEKYSDQFDQEVEKTLTT